MIFWKFVFWHFEWHRAEYFRQVALTLFCCTWKLCWSLFTERQVFDWGLLSRRKVENGKVRAAINCVLELGKRRRRRHARYRNPVILHCKRVTRCSECLTACFGFHARVKNCRNRFFNIHLARVIFFKYIIPCIISTAKRTRIQCI